MTAATGWSVVIVAAVACGYAYAAAVFNRLLAARPAAAGDRRAAALAPAKEAARLLVAQRRRTPGADRLLGRFGLVALPVAALLAAVVVPFGGHVASAMGVGVVWFNAMEVLTWVALWCVGWGANSPFALIGGYRYLAQALGYELPLMFTLITAATGAQSLDVTRIVAAQQHVWFVVWMPIAFVVYLFSVLAFSFLGPFDYPVAQDVSGGVLTEMSGADRLVMQSGRWLLLAVGAAMAVPLFLGGGAGPLLPAWLWSAVKTAGVLALLVLGARRLPTLPADRFVEVGWVVLIPLTLVQALAAALVVLFHGGAL